jgi:GxxExxY protein
MSQLIHEELTYIIRGVMFDIYNKLGPKLLENVYQKAVTYGLRERGITCEPEKEFEVIYRNQSAGKYYVDHWLEKGKLILELKVASQILPIHKAQTISYLKLSDADLAIITNFGTSTIQIERIPNFIRDSTVENKIADFQWKPSQLEKHLLYSELTNTILEALYRVHFILGPAFIHRVYREAVMIELQYQDIGYEYIKKIQIYYNNYHVGEQEAQMIKVENKLLLSVFASKAINKLMVRVMKARMQQLGIKVGLLANFYGKKLVVERVSLT